MKETKPKNLPYERSETYEFGKKKRDGWTYHMKETKTDELTIPKNKKKKDIAPGDELRHKITLFCFFMKSIL